MKIKKHPVTVFNITMNSHGKSRAELDPNYFIYKNYFGSTRYSEEDEVYNGKILGISDLVTYESKNLLKLKIEFEKSVDDYIETCLTINKNPDFPIPYKTPLDKDIEEYYDIYEYLYDEFESGENEDYIELLWCFISQHKSNTLDDEQQIKVEIDYQDGFLAKVKDSSIISSTLINNNLVFLTSDIEELINVTVKRINSKETISKRFGTSYYPTQSAIDHIKKQLL
jgi:hypothetical protein